jgi:hypothetical protein
MTSNTKSSTIDHRTWKTGLPVCSVILKPCAGWLVVGWVTTSEYLLLIVFLAFSGSLDLLFDSDRNGLCTTAMNAFGFLFMAGVARTESEEG